MQRSNTYIIIYTTVLTIVLGVLLSVASEGLKPMQEKQIELERKKFILQAGLEGITEDSDILGIFEKKVKGFVVNNKGEIVEGVMAKDVNAKVEYKKREDDEKLLPVYEIKSETDPSKVEAYVLPVFGYGLWDDIWGFIALKSDLNTIQGVIWDHKGETPGLGSRIRDEEVQKRYQNKQIFEGDVLEGVRMMKGEGKDYSTEAHKVDGMSGATETAKGLNKMVEKYLDLYKGFINSKKQS